MILFLLKIISTPGRLVVRWNRLDLGFAETDFVDIELWGYYEDDDGPHMDLIQVYNI